MSEVTTRATEEYDNAQIEPYDLASAVIDWVATPTGAQALFEAKITVDHFDTRVSQERIAAEILGWVYEYKDKYNEWPISQRTYEHFRQHYVDEDGMALEAERPGRVPIEDVIDRLHTRKLRLDSLAIMEQFADRGDDNLLKSLGHTISQLTNLAMAESHGSEGYVLTDMTGDDIEEFYRQREEYTITTGFPLVDKHLGGYRGFTAIEGRPGGYKSFLCAISAFHAAKMGERVLVLTLELTKEEYLNRLMAYATGLSWHRVHNKLLTEDEIYEMNNRWNEMNEKIEGVLAVKQPDADMMTIPAMKLTAENFGATVVYVDQFSLIDVPGKFSSLQEKEATKCKPLKLWANQLPSKTLIVAHQRNREADKKKKSHDFSLNTSADTDKVGQFADLVIATSQLEDQRRYGAFTMGTPKARNGPQPMFDFATNMKSGCSIKCIGLADE